MWFLKNKEKKAENLYEIYFCDTMDINTAFGKYTDHFKVKITTLEDIDMFKAMYATRRDSWLKSKRGTA